MNESNPPGTPESLGQLSSSDLDQEPNEPLAALVRALHETDEPNTTDDAVPDEVVNEVLEQFRLDQLLEEACVTSGATGGAIALFQEGKLVCLAVTGSSAPHLGSCLNYQSGLSASCVQTRRAQYCSDTENDPDADPKLFESGVKSIAVFPLIDGEQLSGEMQILSSSANAFTESDLDQVQALAIESGYSSAENLEATAEPPLPVMSALFSSQDPDTFAGSEAYEAESSVPVPQQESRFHTDDLWTPILGLLVIAASLLLGGSVGWRLAWQMATLQTQRSSSSAPVGERSKIVRPDSALLPAVNAKPAFESTLDDGPKTPDAVSRRNSTQRNGADSQNGELTIRQNGKLVLRVPSSPPQTPDPKLRDRQPMPSSPAVEEDHSR